MKIPRICGLYGLQNEWAVIIMIIITMMMMIIIIIIIIRRRRRRRMIIKTFYSVMSDTEDCTCLETDFSKTITLI